MPMRLSGSSDSQNAVAMDGNATALPLKL